jgi:hypothetical protein
LLRCFAFILIFMMVLLFFSSWLADVAALFVHAPTAAKRYHRAGIAPYLLGAAGEQEEIQNSLSTRKLALSYDVSLHIHGHAGSLECWAGRRSERLGMLRPLSVQCS